MNRRALSVWFILALVLVVLVGVALSQGGRGLFISPDCNTLVNPEVGFTWCFQAQAPFSVQYWTGTVWSSPTVASGPFTPVSFTVNGVLYGNDVGAIQATSQGTANSVLTANIGAPVFSSTPTLGGVTTTSQAALNVGPFGTSTGNTGEVRYLELAANGTDYVGWKAPDSISTSLIFKLPGTPGTNGQCIVTDGATPVVTLSYGACSGGGSGLTSLNGLSASIQTFANDTNVTIASVTSTHTLGWTGTLSVARGGTGAGTHTTNAVLLGNGTSALLNTGAGAANTVLRVGGGGGAPSFGAVDLSQAAATTGTLPTARLGSGTANSTTFLRGDQTWNAPPASSSLSNYGFNTSMEIWGGGTAVAPTGWTLTAGTVSRNTGQVKVGTASANLTRGAADANLNQNVVGTWGPLAWWLNQSVVFGGWVRCTVAARGQLQINDGVNTQTSSLHTGGSTYEWLSVPLTVSGSATKVEIRAMVVTAATNCHFDGLILARATTVTDWVPDLWRGRKAILSFSSGDHALSVNPSYYGLGNGSPTGGLGADIIAPFKGVARNLWVTSSGGTNTTDTLRFNGFSTTLTATFPIGTTKASNITNEQAITKGDVLNIESTETSGFVHAATIEYEEVP